jgi:hypothetical protein
MGIEKYAKLYPVRFNNKTGKNIFVCISGNASPLGKISTQYIPVDNNISLNLSEGRHIFAYMDIDGNSYGDRSWGKIIVNAINTTKQRITLFVSLNGKKYELERTFFLEVLPDNNQTIILKIGELEHNKEVDPKRTEKNQEKILVCIALFIFIMFIGGSVWFFYRFLKKIKLL